MATAEKTAEAASAALSIPEDSVLVASTGVIGKQIPIDKIAAGVEMLKPQLAATREAAATAAQAIMTTDTEPKEVAVQIEIGGKTVTIGSMCKGSGMIHPNMCTMLSFVATDANISKEMLQKALSEVVPDTYNMVFRRRGYFHKRYRPPPGKRSCRKPGNYGRKRGLQDFQRSTL